MPNDAIPDYPSLLRLTGRRFVVMGAGQGIGEQAAHAVSQAGASVFCVDADRERAERVAGATGGAAGAGDVTRRDDVVRLFGEAKAAMGAVDGIVDIVGMADIKPFAAVSEEAWDAQMAIILGHALLAIRHGAPLLAEAGGGTIAFVGSLSGHRAIPGQVAYGVAKAALHHLVRTTARELAPDNIRINAVAPGYVRTPRLQQMMTADDWARLEDWIPLGRAAQPSEIAAALLFLSSGLASHVTGHILDADGGLNGLAPVPALERS